MNWFVYYASVLSFVIHALNNTCLNLNCRLNNNVCTFDQSLEILCHDDSWKNPCVLTSAHDIVIQSNVKMSSSIGCSVIFNTSGKMVLENGASLYASSIDIQAREVVLQQSAALVVSKLGPIGGEGMGGKSRGASYGGSGGLGSMECQQQQLRYFSTCPSSYLFKESKNRTTCVGSYNLIKDWEVEQTSYVLYGAGTGTAVRGGGRIRVWTEKAISIFSDATLEANGMDATDVGGGSGGSILLDAPALSIQGTIQATGGNANCVVGQKTACTPGGGGGRVMLSYNSGDWKLNDFINVRGGLPGEQVMVANVDDCLAGAAGTDYRVAKGPDGEVIKASLAVSNQGHALATRSVTPLSVRRSIKGKHDSPATSVYIQNRAVCGSSRFELSIGSGETTSGIHISKQSIVLSASDKHPIIMDAEEFFLTGDSVLRSSNGVVIHSTSLSIGANSNITFFGEAILHGSSQVDIAGNIYGNALLNTYVSDTVSAIFIYGGLISTGGVIDTAKAWMYASDSLIITGNISAHHPKTCDDSFENYEESCVDAYGEMEANKLYHTRSNNKNLLKHTTNYSCILTANSSIYIGQEMGKSSAVQCNEILVCANTRVGISTKAKLDTSGYGCNAMKGIGAGNCVNRSHQSFGGGGGYGGEGGGFVDSRGWKYGSQRGFPLLGSGGGCSGGGCGGGVIRMKTQSLILNGSITSNGNNGSNKSGGGGSGGFVELEVQEYVAGFGTIEAKGGDGGRFGRTDNTSALSFGSGGGGGRLLVSICASNIFSYCTGDYYGKYSTAGGRSVNTTSKFQGGKGSDSGQVCPSGYSGLFCHACPQGYYKENSGSDPCVKCTNGPENAHYKSVGSISSTCEWVCNPGYSGTACLAPFELLLHSFGGKFGFAVTLFGIVSFFSFIGVICRHRKHRYRYVSSTKVERQKLVASVVGSQPSLIWTPFRCLALPRLPYPKMAENDLEDHVYRLYLQGDNNSNSPWHLDVEPPAAISSIIYVDEFQALAKRINTAMSWPKSGLTSWGSLFSLLLTVLCYPMLSELIKYRKHRRVNALKRILSRYNHAFLRGARARALLNTVKLGYSPDYTLAYIEILYKENDVTQNDLACPIGKPRLPMVLLLSGCGTYNNPYFLDPTDLLVRSVPQCAELTTFIDDAWIEVVAEINARLRVINSSCLYETLSPVVLFLERKNMSKSLLGGLHVQIGKFWPSSFPKTGSSFKLGLYLTSAVSISAERKDPIFTNSAIGYTTTDNLLRISDGDRFGPAFGVLGDGSSGDSGDTSHRKSDKYSIREEALRLRTRTASSIESSGFDDASADIDIDDLECVDDSMPLPGIIWTHTELQALNRTSTQKRLVWFLQRYCLPCNLYKISWVPSVWAWIFALLILLLADLGMAFSIIVNLKCINDGMTNTECRYVKRS